MNTASRLYRITPVGAERPNHFVDSFASVLDKLDIPAENLERLKIGHRIPSAGNYVERVA